MASTPIVPKLQAGGGNVSAHEATQTISSMSPTILKYLKNIYGSLGGQDAALDRKEVAHFLDEVQHVDRSQPSELLPDKDSIDFKDFLDYAASPAFNALQPPKKVDLGYPLSNYFISSSHNTYLTGNQLYGSASTDGYRNVLLRGCRCIEIDVWDGEPKEQKPPVEGSQSVTDDGKITPWSSYSTATRAEPRVLHGHTLTKEISFREVCQAIKETAFVASNLPVIVSLEVHTSLEQQEIMVEIMHQVWGDHLVDPPTDLNALKLPTPGDLLNRILIKVKYAPLQPTASTDSTALAQTQFHTSSPSSSEDEALVAAKHKLPTHSKPKKPKKVKVLPALSNLGIFTRACHFSSFTQPEATLATHVFSLSEKSLGEMETGPHAISLFNHNKAFLMRAYPSGTRVSSSNLDPAPLWRKGVQMVALNWQKWDKGTMLNEAMFAGGGGWVLKPQGYLHRVHDNGQSATSKDDPSLDTIEAKTLDLTVTIYAGQSLPLPIGDEKEKNFHPYVKVELHVESSSEPPSTAASSSSSLLTTTTARPSTSRTSSRYSIHGSRKENSSNNDNNNEKESSIYKRVTKSRKGCDPDFAQEVVAFKAVRGVVDELSFLRFKIMDDELGKDDMAGWACLRLSRLRPGWRFLRVSDALGRASNGVLLLKISKEVS